MIRFCSLQPKVCEEALGERSPPPPPSSPVGAEGEKGNNSCSLWPFWKKNRHLSDEVETESWAGISCKLVFYLLLQISHYILVRERFSKTLGGGNFCSTADSVIHQELNKLGGWLTCAWDCQALYVQLPNICTTKSAASLVPKLLYKIHHACLNNPIIALNCYLGTVWGAA